MSKRKKMMFIIFSIFVIIVLLVCCLYVLEKYKKEDADAVPKTVNAISDMTTFKEDVPEKPEQEFLNSDLLEQELPPLTEETVKLNDIYAAQGSTVLFQYYEPEAASYEWEYYDIPSREWKPAAESDIRNRTDELQRQVSCYTVKALSENHELMVKCIVHFPEKAAKEYKASLYVLEKEITDIFIEPISVHANTAIAAAELPVTVTYEDGTSEQIIGLNGLYFIETAEKKEASSTVSGNRVETITTTVIECEYLIIGLEEKEVKVRYHFAENEESIRETVCLIAGEDLQAPNISDVIISPYTVRNVDEAVTITVDIAAEDNETPYPYLEYAFVIADKEPDENDWIKKSSFSIDILKNGIYIAYVRDQSGNLAKKEKEVITVDMKPPVIEAVSLSNAEGWCKSNTIIVKAADAGEIMYRFMCTADSTDSDWITYSEYSVEKNGTWIIQAKDLAGNMSETELVIQNIDKEAPIIKSIKTIGE